MKTKRSPLDHPAVMIAACMLVGSVAFYMGVNFHIARPKSPSAPAHPPPASRYTAQPTSIDSNRDHSVRTIQVTPTPVTQRVTHTGPTLVLRVRLSPKSLALQLSDLPPGFIKDSESFVSNDRGGSTMSYSVVYGRPFFLGMLGVRSSVGAYISPRTAHQAYSRATRMLGTLSSNDMPSSLLHSLKGLRIVSVQQMSVTPIGDEYIGYLMDFKADQINLSAPLIIFRQGPYIATILTYGISNTFDPSTASGFAQSVSRHIAQAPSEVAAWIAPQPAPSPQTVPTIVATLLPSPLPTPSPTPRHPLAAAIPLVTATPVWPPKVYIAALRASKTPVTTFHVGVSKVWCLVRNSTLPSGAVSVSINWRQEQPDLSLFQITQKPWGGPVTGSWYIVASTPAKYRCDVAVNGNSFGVARFSVVP